MCSTHAGSLFLRAAVLAVFLTGCSDDKKAAAPPKPGTLAYDWYVSGEAYKTGDYIRAMDHLSRLAVANSEYRERAKMWLIVLAGGIADGYSDLANAYEAGARANTAEASELRRNMREARNAANAVAMRFAETIHDVLGKTKDPKFQFDFGFPAGETSEPIQVTRIAKGLNVQAADYAVAKTKMTQRGVVRYAAALAGSPDDLQKARTQFASPPHDAVLTATANTLIRLADLFGPKKLDYPQRGNALCKEALEAINLLPDSADKKKLEAKGKDELKRYKVSAS